MDRMRPAGARVESVVFAAFEFVGVMTGNGVPAGAGGGAPAFCSRAE